MESSPHGRNGTVLTLTETALFNPWKHWGNYSILFFIDCLQRFYAHNAKTTISALKSITAVQTVYNCIYCYKSKHFMSNTTCYNIGHDSRDENGNKLNPGKLRIGQCQANVNYKKPENVHGYMCNFHGITVSLLSLSSVSYWLGVFLSFCTSALFIDSLSLFLPLIIHFKFLVLIESIKMIALKF